MVTAAMPVTTDSVISQVLAYHAALCPEAEASAWPGESPQLPITAGLRTPTTNRMPDVRKSEPVIRSRRRATEEESLVMS